MTDFNFVKTKEAIFDVAIRLMADLDYECINMRMIAAELGIKAASIYNHFEKKEEILKVIYEYYKEHFFDNRKSTDEMKSIIRYGSRDEIISAFAFTFENEDIKKYTRMILITKIIYIRYAKDETARDIFLNLMTKDTEKMVKNLLDYGIQIGRFAPFDSATFAYIMNSLRHFMGIRAFADKDYQVAQLDIEANINNMIKNLIPFN